MSEGKDQVPKIEIYQEEELQSRLAQLRAKIVQAISDLRQEEVDHSPSIKVLQQTLDDQELLKGQLLNNFHGLLPGGSRRRFATDIQRDEWERVFADIDHLIPELGFSLQEISSWRGTKYSQMDEATKKRRNDLLLGLFFRLEKKYPNLNLRG